MRRIAIVLLLLTAVCLLPPREAAADHAAFLETIKAAGLNLPGLEMPLSSAYGSGTNGAYGGGSHAGQQTIYGQVTAPLADAYRDFDVEKRMAALQRFDEEAAKGHLTISQET